MKKSLWLVLVLMLACILALTACDNNSEQQNDLPIENPPIISVIDGYVAVNGVKTEYEVNKADTITVEDGYVVVNGTKTEHKVHTEPTISVIDGYVAVNGVKTEYEVNKVDVITVEDGYVVVNGTKTEHKVHTEPTVSVIDGYVAVNGVKTEYEVKNKNHSFGNWKLYNESETDCEKKLYYRTCSDCFTVEWKEGSYENHDFRIVTTPATCQAKGYDTKTCKNCGTIEICNETPITNHVFETFYTTNNSFHWNKCSTCDITTERIEHTVDNSGICTVCDALVGATEGIIYGLSSDGTYYEVIGYEGTSTQVKIADIYNDLPVKIIYKEAFKGQKEIVSVVVPDTVTVIGNYAFSGCSSLKNIVMGNGVITINSCAFSSCSALTGIVIPDSVTTIQSYAFQYCSALKSVVIPDSVINIGKGAFSTHTSKEYNSCLYVGWEENPYAVLVGVVNKNFATYEIHKDTKIIAGGAFEDCTRLDNIVISKDIRGIGYRAFYNCNSLTKVYYLGTSMDWSNVSIGDDNFKLKSAIHYYEANSPIDTVYKYWYYNNGVPTVWE